MNETTSLIPINNSVMLLLPLLIVIATALLVFMVDLFTTRKSVLAWITATGLLCGAAAAAGHWVKIDGGIDLVTRVTERGFNNSIALDKYSAFAMVLVAGIAVLTVLLSDAYMTARKVPLGEYYGLLLLVVSGMIAMAMATDVITFFIAFELMSLPSYVLAGFVRGDKRAGEAGLKYFVNGAFASAILVFGLALLVGYTGETNYYTIGDSVAGLTGFAGALMLAVLLILIGFAFKISAVPFHGWAPDVYEGAPTPVTAFMSVGVKAAAFMGFMRLFSVLVLPFVLPDSMPEIWVENNHLITMWTSVLVLIAIPTMILGNVLALPQRNL